MGKLLARLKGNKTYATAITILIVVGLKSQGLTVPNEVWVTLFALGLGFLRAGVKKDNND